MLVYLDNSMSSAPGSPGARGGKAGLNENFAREVMELHTLGADGGYTQEDVVTLARILTGWGINRPDARLFPEHAAVFEGARHDYGAKVFLGHPIKSRGKAEGEEALDILARSPAPPATSAANWRSISSPTIRPPVSSSGLPPGFSRPTGISGSC